MTWAYRGFLDSQEEYRKKTDGAYELAMSMLKKEGGQNWKDKLAQVDIIHICIQAARLYLTLPDNQTTPLDKS